MRTGGGTRILEPRSFIGNCKIGHGCKIHAGVWIGDDVEIGDGVHIEPFSFLPTGVKLGNRVFIGPRVTFTNDKYPPSDEWLETFVGHGASIGAGAVILPGIIIGENAVIGAGSVVTKNVPDNAVVYGNPAKPKGEG